MRRTMAHYRSQSIFGPSDGQNASKDKDFSAYIRRSEGKQEIERSREGRKEKK
jgi:hypothetical protein